MFSYALWWRLFGTYSCSHHLISLLLHRWLRSKRRCLKAAVSFINTGTGSETQRDGYQIRRSALKFSIPYATTIAGALAMAHGVAALAKGPITVKPIQEYHR